MPSGLVLVMILIAMVGIAAGLSFAILRIAATIRLVRQLRLSTSERWVVLRHRCGERLSLNPEIGPPLLATVQVPIRSATLRSSQRRRRRGWKEWLLWST